MVHPTVPSVAELRASFETKPSAYKVSSHPTRTEILSLRKTTRSNLQKLPCILPGTDITGWSWFLLSNDEWNEHHTDLLPIPALAAAPDEQPALPGFPNVLNPGMFIIQPEWSGKQMAEHKTIYDQDLYLFQYKMNLEQACLLDLAEAIPNELIADLYNDDDEIRISVTKSYLLTYMETQWTSLKPTDIATIMHTLNTPFDDSLTIPQYFKR